MDVSILIYMFIYGFCPYEYARFICCVEKFNSVMTDKNGDLLNSQEMDFIIELQGIIGETIKLKTFESKAPHMFSGYTVEDKFIMELTVYGKKLKILPESIRYLIKIKKLYLDKNDLFTLPDSIGNLGNLEVLSVSNNKLETIPQSIGCLKKLKILTLAGNNLTALPEEIGNILNLEVIFLQDNNIETLPESISNLKHLKSIYIYNNPQLILSRNLKEFFNSMKEKGVEVILKKNFSISEVPSLKEGADPIFMTDIGMFTYKELMDDPLLKHLADEFFETRRKKK